MAAPYDYTQPYGAPPGFPPAYGAPPAYPPLAYPPPAFPGYPTYGAPPPAYGAPPASADEVRTIFISGFPADVKDRELNNLMRFLPGYEVGTPMGSSSRSCNLMGDMHENLSWCIFLAFWLSTNTPTSHFLP